jgi:hypothetical protein
MFEKARILDHRAMRTKSRRSTAGDSVSGFLPIDAPAVRAELSGAVAVSVFAFFGNFVGTWGCSVSSMRRSANIEEPGREPMKPLDLDHPFDDVSLGKIADSQRHRMIMSEVV